MNNLQISNTVCASHKTLLEYPRPKPETTDRGFPALNTISTLAPSSREEFTWLVLATFPITLNTKETDVSAQYSEQLAISVRKCLSQPMETTEKC